MARRTQVTTPEAVPASVRPKAGKPHRDPNESRADRFVRLANRRLPDALRAIERLGNLATSNYEYREARAVHEIVN